jgi:hypothetical protein
MRSDSFVDVSKRLCVEEGTPCIRHVTPHKKIIDWLMCPGCDDSGSTSKEKPDRWRCKNAEGLPRIMKQKGYQKSCDTIANGKVLFITVAASVMLSDRDKHH